MLYVHGLVLSPSVVLPVMSKAPKGTPQALKRGARRGHHPLMLQAMPLYLGARLWRLLGSFSVRRGACLWRLSELYNYFF